MTFVALRLLVRLRLHKIAKQGRPHLRAIARQKFDRFDTSAFLGVNGISAAIASTSYRSFQVNTHDFLLYLSLFLSFSLSLVPSMSLPVAILLLTAIAR